MDYGSHSGNDDYDRRGHSPSSYSGRYRNESDYRRGARGYSPRRQDWSRDRRGGSPERYSSSWRVNPERSPHYRRSRSRSSSRGRRRSRSESRDRYRDGSRSNKRSPSYGTRNRYKRRSSSGSSSSSSSSSGGQRKKQGTKEDFFKTMYADVEPELPQAYLHPALNRSAVNAASSQPASFAPVSRENVIAQPVSNTVGFAALSQAYSGNSPKKSYAPDTDDEDRFLYGDDDNDEMQKPVVAQVAPVPPSQPVARSLSTENNSVTPGGFDSNALKNVLKAIGFDFEMSAQNSQAAVKKPDEPTKTAAKVQPTPAPQPQPDMTQRIPTIGTRPTVHAAPAPTQPESADQYYQPYASYDQNQTASYTIQPVSAQVQSSPLGYPMTIPDPNNPGGTLLVYRPVNASAQPQVLYQQQGGAVHPPPSGRIVLPPQRSDPVPAVKKSDKELRQERLNYLQEELEKLKKQQNELLRKKRREKDGHKDPLIKKNTLLQAGVEEQIREIRQAAERADDSASESSDDDDDDQKLKEAKYEYIDPGNHWCRLCNIFSVDLTLFLSHLHSKVHRKAIDPYDRPWDEGDDKKNSKNSNCHTKSLKGAEFLIPVTGYYCTICQTFSGDQICADNHLKSFTHNVVYKKHCEKCPSYEKKYKKKKRAAMETAPNIGKKKEIKQETEVKMIGLGIKAEKPEPQWVEKSPPKYLDQQVKYVGKESYEEKHESEKKKGKKRKADRERSQEMDKERDTQRQPSRRDFTDSSHRWDKPIQDRQMQKTYPDPYMERPQTTSYRRDGENDDRRVQKQYPEVEHQRERAPDRERPRKAQHWSPGYDEYERQQGDRYESRDKHQSEEKRRRSRSRDRDGRWVEKPLPQDSGRRLERGNKESIVAGAKIPTPGFGKFKWNSTTRRETSSFDQVPVDNHVPARETIDNKNGEFSGKGKIAIKITGKTHYPPRLSAPSSTFASKSNAEQEKRAAMASELQRKVEAMKRENALRNQLSSITLPSGRTAKQKQSKPNTAAVMLGTRSIGKHNTLLLAKSLKSKPGRKDEEEVITHEIEADVSPPRPPVEDAQQPPPPGDFEPPPPGEEDIEFGIGEDDGGNSEASGISMELASDEN